MRAAVLLALAASAMAYRITSPNAMKGWSSKGPNTVKWDKVSTDSKTFTMMLVNPDMGDPVVVAPVVNGADRTATIKSPSGGWPEGDGYRINFVKDQKNPDTLYAQSGIFSIDDTTTNTTPKTPKTSESKPKSDDTETS